jgi:23S rRNA (adenine2503-C2)-methyltransferase
LIINTKLNLKLLSKEEIFLFIEKIGLPRYRAEQLLNWIYKRHASEIDAITEFSKDLRSHLNGIAFISNLELVERLQSADGTEKFLFSLEDGNTIESVLIPDEDRFTLCISSQAGCAIGCQFCLTGKSGFVRNLESYEIIDQIIAVNKIMSETDDKNIPTLLKGGKGGLPDKKITNIVFMGMGEPLMNFDNVVEALWRIIQFIGISKRKITVSTAGIVPKMLLLPFKAPDINLAISLNTADNETRNRLMPINKKYPIESLIASCKKYPLQPGRRITFEYVMIDGINDSSYDAHRLTKLLKGIRCKINLIPLNPHPESDFKRPPEKRILEFQKILLNKNIRALIRESRGQDILAACGQLRAGNR